MTDKSKYYRELLIETAVETKNETDEHKVSDPDLLYNIVMGFLESAYMNKR